MVRRCAFFLFVIMALCAIPVVCLAQQAASQSDPGMASQSTSPGVFLQKVQNFEVVFDGSMSMTDDFNGQSKFDTAKTTMQRFNEAIPNIKLMGAFRLCGCDTCPYAEESKLIYGPEYYTKSGMGAAINKLEYAAGSTPMALSINGVKDDIRPLKGKTAVIVISDGVGVKYDAVRAVQDLKKEYGDNVTVYTLWVGNDTDARVNLDKMAAAGGTKGAIPVTDIAGATGMSNFVETVFLEEILDSDHDGVPDNMDKCPNTPQGVKVDKNGCPIDTDGDGVPDYMDKCPNTPKGAIVDEDGCWTIHNINFDFNKANIKPGFYPILNNVFKVMKENKDLKIVINGHTDNIGPEAYNMKLSKRRALAAKAYLVKKGISKDRITTKGYGFSRPIASNKTEEGRAKNRRVEFEPMP